ncbi:PR domain zinc finger protein 14-like [Clytia hemisphaerica]|uniref:PR domain zinc finger protein 14 n=1 Tax=Clytia hemisphaerica TaxID=252671 RepID=A0A7M5V280_9CNID
MEKLMINREYAGGRMIKLNNAKNNHINQGRLYRKSIFPYASYMTPYPAPPMGLHQPYLPPHLAEDNYTNWLPPKILPINKVKNFRSPHSSPPQMKMHSMNYNFSREDVDAVLYGYVGDRCDRQKTSHSLSGLCTSPTNECTFEQDLILPKTLVMKRLHIGPISHKGIFASEAIKKGTTYGPFKGKIIRANNSHEINLENSWEVFNKDGSLLHYICPTRDNSCWMKFVNSARYAKEQNLSVLQRGDQLYYEVIEDIQPDTELLVWYGETYFNYMGFPMAIKSSTTTSIPRKQFSPPADREMEKESALIEAKAGSFPCNRCGKIFSYEYYREKHLKYTRCVDKGDRKFPCHLCQRSFEKKDRLRIHILHVHQKYRPHVCKICGKRFSQSSSLNKHSRVHTGERPYACPHCPKSFTASSILRTHLRQHNGERPFKCKFCGKAFASHAAHDSHVRRTHEKLKTFSCGVCAKTFSMEFELKFHLSTHTHHELAGNFINGGTQRSRSYSEESESSLIIDIENEVDL